MVDTKPSIYPRVFNYVVYKITFPNGKIYVGKDIGSEGHSIRYFGSWSREAVEADFSKQELSNFHIWKEILFESTDKLEVSQKEMELIELLEANNPSKGYNSIPKFGS